LLIAVALMVNAVVATLLKKLLFVIVVVVILRNSRAEPMFAVFCTKSLESIERDRPLI